MFIEQNQAPVKSEPQNVRDENVSDILFHSPPPKVGDGNPPVARCDFVVNPYNGERKRNVQKGTAVMFNQSLSVSNSMKLIRFFRIVSVFGAVVMIARALIFIAVVSGILYLLP